jgi:hypothetical protein
VNQLIRISLWMLGASVVCLLLAALEALTGIVGWLAPTEAHAFGMLVVAVPCVMIVRSYMHGAIAMPNVRRMVAPRRQHRTYQRRMEGMQ